jgi:outer membrane protein OmpA-like peptidoglycan-associated protein
MRHIFFMALVLAVLNAAVPGQFNQAIETNWDNVTCRLEAFQQNDFRLYLHVVFENSGEEEMSAGKAISFKDIYLLDPENDSKIFILKDADEKFLAGPVADFNEGGRWWINVPPGGKRILWAMFPPVAEGALLDVVIPEIFPFEGIEFSQGRDGNSNSHETNLYPAEAVLISARRSTGSVSARMRLVKDSDMEVEGGAIWYKDAYLFDSENGRKYPVLKDSDGNYVAEPVSDKNEGGRWWPSSMNREGKALLYLKFQPPPDQVTAVDLVVPSLVPFLEVGIPGKSGVSETSGIEVRGLQTGIRRIMKDLEAVETEEEIRIQLSSEILFEFDSYELTSNAVPVLKKVFQVLGDYPGNSIQIEGHTDSEGTDSYNQTLSENRANSVKEWLVTAGIDSSRLQTIGYGESKAVASNETDEGRTKNRRVEIIIKK